MMSTDRLEILEETVQLTHRWINELDHALRWNDKHRCLRLLRVVLHTLRDCLPLVENAQLAAQLPTLVRGLYFEQWRPGHIEPYRITAEDFLERIEDAFPDDPLFDPAEATSAVIALLSRKITKGEIEDVLGCLPRDIRNLWIGIATLAAE